MNYGEGGMAKRACAAADRTGHAMLHTLYQQSLKNNAEFFSEYFALDLIMDDEGACRGVMAWELDTGRIHRFRSYGGDCDRRLWPNLLLDDPGAHLHRRRQCDGAARGVGAPG